MDKELDQTINYCICGRVIDTDQIHCGRTECIEQYENISNHIKKFFKMLSDERNKQKAYQYFETLNPAIQAGILLELDDDLFIYYIQMMGEENVVNLFQVPSDALRLRFLQFLEPRLAKQLEKEFQTKKYDKEALLDYFLNLINLIILLHQKKL